MSTAVPPAAGPVLDPDEPPSIQKLRREIHEIRVSLIRSAQRLGYDHENGLVKQVLYRCVAGPVQVTEGGAMYQNTSLGQFRPLTYEQ